MNGSKIPLGRTHKPNGQTAIYLPFRPFVFVARQVPRALYSTGLLAAAHLSNESVPEPNFYPISYLQPGKYRLLPQEELLRQQRDIFKDIRNSDILRRQLLLTKPADG